MQACNIEILSTMILPWMKELKVHIAQRNFRRQMSWFSSHKKNVFNKSDAQSVADLGYYISAFEHLVNRSVQFTFTTGNWIFSVPWYAEDEQYNRAGISKLVGVPGQSVSQAVIHLSKEAE